MASVVDVSKLTPQATDIKIGGEKIKLFNDVNNAKIS